MTNPRPRHEKLAEIIGETPVIPVLVLHDAATALPIARALVEGGLSVLEVTLRTPAALHAVEEIARHVKNARVGVGSVIDPAQFGAAARAGAEFAVSPGATPELELAAAEAQVPWLPGAQTVSEVLELRSRGFRLLKFFPAQVCGGAAFLRALSGPVPDVRFCPTGGVSPELSREYLALPNVACVGGSWLTPAELIKAQRWDEVRALAQAASLLPRGPAS